MKTKNQLTNRILSLVLVFVLVLGMVPTVAFAAEPVEAQEYPNIPNNSTPFPYGSYFYFTANNCLYSIYMYNLKANSGITHIKLYTMSGGMVFIAQQNGEWDDGSYRSINANHGSMTPYPLSNLPKSAGESVELHYNSNYEENIWGPSFTVTCLAVGSPEWAWNGTTATARFLSEDGNAAVTRTVNGQLTSTTPAENCLQNVVRNYSATVTLNGKSYVGYKQVSGEAGPHSYTKETVADNYLKSAATCTAAAVYYKSCEYCGTSSNSDDATFTYGSAPGHTLRYEVKENTTNVLEETCQNNCGHIATATLSTPQVEYFYNPNGVDVGANVTFSNNWKGSKQHDCLTISNDNAGISTANATIYVMPAKVLTYQYHILPADISQSFAQCWPDVYNGNSLKPAVFYRPNAVGIGGTKLTEGQDYTVQWDKTDLTQAGEYNLTVTGMGNYTGSFTQKITVNPANLKNVSVVNNKADFDYTGEAQKLEVTASGETVDGSQVTFTYRVGESGEYVSEPAVTDGGTHTVYWKASAPNHNDVTGSFTVTVNPVNGDSSVSIADWVYGNTASTPVPVSSTNGIDNVTYQYKVKGADDSTYTATVPTQAGDYTVKATFPATTNYKMAEATADFTVSKRPITVTANDASKTYGDTDPELTWTVTSGTELAGEKLTLIISRAAGEDAGTYAIAVGQPEGANENYDITFVNGTFTISKAALTVTANAVSKTYGEADPELTYKVEGLVNGDELTGQLERVAGENVGTYAVALGTLTAGGNYTITYTGADFTISKRDVTVTAKDQTITYGDAISNTEITSDGLVDGHSITVTLTPSTANVTVDGTITAGAAVITADGTDVTANYEIAYGEPSVLVIQPDTSKIDTLTTENVTSANEADIQAVQEMLENADSTKEEWEAISGKCEALIEKIEEVEAQMKEATDEAAAFDAETVNSTDTEELEQLAEDIEALLDSDNLTEDERAALEEVLEQVSGMIDTIENTAEDSRAAIDTIDALDPETVTSADKDELEQAVETIDELLAEDHLTEEERKALEDAKADAEALITVIGSAQAATDTENTEKVEDVTAENVVPEDKADLEEAKADLEKALEDNGSNYTEEEKNGIQEEIDRLDAAIEALENVEAVTESITQLPEAVEPDDAETAQKILDAKKAYDALTDHEKSLVNETAKEKLGELVTALTAYDIIKGDGSTWTKDSAGTITFTANGPFSKFVGIKVDGKDVDNADYEAKSGSTIITLNQKFLKKLSTGKHTITVIYTDGEASGTFLIRAEAGTPATGDNFNILLWTSVMIVNLAAISVLLINQKKRRYVK